MNLLHHCPSTQPLLLPVVPEPPATSADTQQDNSRSAEAHFCHALIAHIAQTHAIIIAEPVTINELAAHLEHWMGQGVSRLLILPWNVPVATTQLVQQAMNACHHIGAETVSATSFVLTHPLTVPEVSPVGPLGGFLPPQPRLDRFVEQWPGWRHISTVVRSERTAMLIIHTGTSPSRQRGNRSSSDTLQRLIGALCTPCSQEQDAPASASSDSRGRKDSVIYAQYLSRMVSAALEALRSLSPISAGQQE